MYLAKSSTWLLILATLLSACQNTPDSSRATWRCAEANPTRAAETMTTRAPQTIATRPYKKLGGDGVVAVDPCTGYAYVAGSGHLTILRGADIIGEIGIARSGFRTMAIDETRGLLYIANRNSDNVTVIRGTEQIGVVPTAGTDPRGVAVEPHSGYAYITSPYKGRPLGDIEGNILVISGTQVIDNLKLGQVAAQHVATDPLSGLVYVGAGKKALVFKDLHEIARYEVEEAVDSLDANPHTGEVYALAHATLYRFKDGKLIDSVVLVRDNAMGNVDQIRVNPVTGAVYIPHSGYVPTEGRVVVVRNMQVVEDVQVGGRAALAIDPLTGLVYAANYGGKDGPDLNTVSVIDGTKVIATIKVAWYPYKIALNPANGWVYVTSSGIVTILGYPEQKTNPYPGPYPK